MTLPSKGKRVLLVTFAILQNVFVGGIVYGWAGVAGTLLIASEEDGGAGLTLDETTSIFAMSASIASFSSLLLGIVMDRYGPRVASFLSNVIIGLGFQIFASARSYPGFALGACTIAFGGPGIQVSVVHLSNLFPESQFLVMSAVNGSISLSFAVLPIFAVLWESYGIAFRPMFQSYVVVVLLSAVGALLLWPDSPYEAEDLDMDELLLQDTAASPLTVEPSPQKAVMEASRHTHLIEQPLDSYLRTNLRNELDRHASFIFSQEALETGQLPLLSLKDLPFRSQLMSGSYFRIIMYFVAACFFANFYVASITTEFADIDFFPIEEQQSMARTFALVMSVGMVGSFVVGWLMDHAGLETCTALTLVLGQLHMVILIFFAEHGPLMTVGFVFYTLFRQFLFPVYIACLSARLGFKYFGILSGIGFAISGVTQLYIAPLVHLVQGTCHVAAVEGCTHGYWLELHIVQLCLFISLGFVPLWDHRVKVQRQRAVELTKIGSMTSLSTYGAVTLSFD